MTTLTAAAASDLFREAPERFIDVGAGEVAYRRVGTGPDVLFVHGWPVSGATFRSLLPYLAEQVTCHIIDFPGAGSSRFTPATRLTIDQHITTVRRVIDALQLESVALVGHDSGGLIARHAMAGDPRLRSLGLIDTEQMQLGWKFRSFIASRHLPGLGASLGWVCGQPRLRRNSLLFGGAFLDRSLLDGEFDEFFLKPIHDISARRNAAVSLLKNFDLDSIRQLAQVHPQIDVPVQLVWGAKDPFFPVKWAHDMVATFPNAKLHVVENTALFCHEERPEEVARALLPTLLSEEK